MVVASAQSLNKASTQACVNEEHGLTIANTPTHRPSTAEMNSEVKGNKLFSLQGGESHDTEREQHFHSNRFADQYDKRRNTNLAADTS